jgi:hypothetical protein
MASIRKRFDQRREHPSITLTLCGVVLGAAAFGFAAAGVWYQFCLDHGEPEAAAAFADLAPPPAVILLASLGLIVTVGIQLEILLKRARTDQSPQQPQAAAESKRSVPPRLAPTAGGTSRADADEAENRVGHAQEATV